MAIVRETPGDGEYGSLAAAIAASETDIEIVGEWASAETSHYTISSTTTIEATGDAKHPGYVGSSPTHWRAKPTSSGHTFTVNDDLTVTGLDVAILSSGASDECFRMAASGGTLTLNKCLLHSSGTTDQDGVYAGDIDCTVNVNECVIYNFERCGLHPQNYGNIAVSQTWNIRSSVIVDCGSGATSSNDDGGIGVRLRNGDSVANINVYNSLVLNNGAYGDYRNSGTSYLYGTVNWNIHQSFDSDGSIALRDTGAVDCQGNMNLTDDNTKSADGDWVIVYETASGSEDFRLQSNDHNEAQDYSSTATGAGMTISSTTDIVGTSRPQDTDYDCGAFEIVSDVLPIKFTFPSDYFPQNYWQADYWQDLATTVVRQLLVSISNITLTSDITATQRRELVPALSNTTVVSSPEIQILRNLSVEISNATSTTDIAVLVQGFIHLIVAVSNTTSTANISPVLLRSLVTNLINTTSTSDIAVILEAVINLTVGISNTTSTTNISQTMVRSLIAIIENDTATSLVSNNQIRRLAIAIINLTSTSSIDIILSNLKLLTVAITNTTLTTGLDITVKRALIADVINASSTSNIAALKGIYLSPAIVNETNTSDTHQHILRLLAAGVQNSTITSDDVVVILWSLAICGSDSLSVSITQDLLSCVIEQDDQSCTIVPDITSVIII